MPMCLRKSNVKFILPIVPIFIFITISVSYAVILRHDFKAKFVSEIKTKDVLTGKEIVLKSGCYTCHSFIKGKRYDGVESLANWGDKGLSIKQTEKAIRSCKADVYCSQILTDKQVKYVAEYLNSLR